MDREASVEVRENSAQEVKSQPCQKELGRRPCGQSRPMSTVASMA